MVLYLVLSNLSLDPCEYLPMPWLASAIACPIFRVKLVLALRVSAFRDCGHGDCQMPEVMPGLRPPL
eukprot:14786691-Alexandrium_andersonii.AAC.1